MTDAKYHALQVKALRTARRYLRQYQTQIERVERILDRKIESKNKITATGYDAYVAAYNKVTGLRSTLDRAMADGIVQF